MNQFSVNNRLVLEAHKTDKSLKANVSNGFATIAQKTGVKGLTVLMEARLPNGTVIPAGSRAYIREELLHTQQWALKPLECDTLPGQFMIVDVAHVEFITPPPEKPAA